jgi:hypothetical protein
VDAYRAATPGRQQFNTTNRARASNSAGQRGQGEFVSPATALAHPFPSANTTLGVLVVVR